MLPICYVASYVLSSTGVLDDATQAAHLLSRIGVAIVEDFIKTVCMYGLKNHSQNENY